MWCKHILTHIFKYTLLSSITSLLVHLNHCYFLTDKLPAEMSNCQSINTHKKTKHHNLFLLSIFQMSRTSTFTDLAAFHSRNSQRTHFAKYWRCAEVRCEVSKDCNSIIDDDTYCDDSTVFCRAQHTVEYSQHLQLRAFDRGSKNNNFLSNSKLYHTYLSNLPNHGNIKLPFNIRRCNTALKKAKLSKEWEPLPTVIHKTFCFICFLGNFCCLKITLSYRCLQFLYALVNLFRKITF